MEQRIPKAMLTARCTSSAARAFAGDVLAGCYSMEEVREISGGTASIGGSEVHVGEIIAPEHTYDDPKQADEKSRVKAIARRLRGGSAAEPRRAHGAGCAGDAGMLPSVATQDAERWRDGAQCYHGVRITSCHGRVVP